MSFNKKFFTTGGIVASTPPAAAAFDPLQNFETVTYTGNGGTQKITGYIRKGAAFNGSSSYIQADGIFSSSPSVMSVSVWFRTTVDGNILDIGDNSVTAAQNRIFFSGGLLYVTINDGDGGFVTTSATGLQDGNWHHIVAVWDDGTVTNGIKMYIDGATTPTAQGNSTQSFNSALDLFIGANDNRGALGTPVIRQYLNGGIDQVRIFNKALSSGEVTTLYGETYASSTKSTTDIFGDGSGVALYELDDDANDTGIYPYGTGDIDSGQSAVFNGSSSKINTGIVLSSTTFSVSVWFKTSVTGRTIIGNFNSSASSVNDRDGFVIDAEKYIFNENDVEIFRNYYNAGNLADNNWHNIVLTNDGSNSKVYIDGTLDRTDNSTGWNTLSPQDIHIGFTQRSPIVNWFNGLIDQVRVYSSALSASDVEALVSETNVPTANLVAHYKLDGDATDETTNYNGTATSITYSDPAEFPLIAYKGTPTNVNFLGMAFQPDLVWVKCRSTADPSALVDSVRGANETLFSSETHEQRNRTSVTAFDSNGFTLGNYANTNRLNDTYVAWCWKAADTTTTISAGTVGNTIASDVRANQDAGFSIVSFTGDGNNSATVGHGLSSAPEMIIVKDRSAANHWAVVHTSCTITGTTTIVDPEYKMLRLDSTDAEYDYQNLVVSPGQSSTTFTLGNQVNVNGLNNTYIAYCFHSVDGYQKLGSYTGNGTTGQTINVGFTPRFVMIKAYTNSSAYTSWGMFDNQRLASSTDVNALWANQSAAEGYRGNGTSTDTYLELEFITNTGFRLTDASDELNDPNNDYIYLAIA